MSNDDLFAGALRRAVSTLEPPTERLVAGGLARGRRRRRIRHTVAVGTGAALLAAVVALGAVLLPGTTAAPRQRSVAGAPHATSAPPSKPAHRVVLPALTPQALLQTALDGLPRAGRTTHYTGRSMSGFVGTEFVYDDGHGAAQVDVALEYGPGAETVKQFMHDTHRPRQPRPDGSSLVTIRRYEYSHPDHGAKQWSVHLFRPDGAYVSITEWNSPQEKDAETTRSAPPFTIAELTRWIESTQWPTAISVEQAKHAAHLFTPDR